MNILAIDTAGFSSSIALVKDGKNVIFNKINSNYIPDKIWSDYYRLLPIQHKKFLLKGLKKINWKNVDIMAVSFPSGINSCVEVGVSTAKYFSSRYGKSLIKVDHILAHIYSTWIDRKIENFNFPILVFSASGSHSDFALLKDKSNCQIIYGSVPQKSKGWVKIFIGVGKIFYQMAKQLNFNSASGLGIDKLMEAAARGDPFKYDFTKYYKGSLLNLDFLNFIELIDKFLEEKRRKLKNLPKNLVKDVAASFQESITTIIADKIIKIARIKKAKEIHMAGGISENKYLENKLKEILQREKLPIILRYPTKKEYRLDNAAMIGSLAYYQKRFKIKFKNFEPSVTRHL